MITAANTASVTLKRYQRNPILSPLAHSAWENICTCNPAAWYDGKKVWLLYRGGPDTEQHPVSLGLAESEDGFHFRRVSDQPVFGPSEDGWDGGCIEDPRIVQFGDTYFVTYAARMFPPAAYWRKKFPLNAFNPSLPEEAPIAARENLAVTMADRLGKPDLAIEQLQLLLDLPDQPERKRAEWLGWIAAWHQKYRQDQAAARAVLERIIREFPRLPQAMAARRQIELMEVAQTVQAAPPLPQIRIRVEP